MLLEVQRAFQVTVTSRNDVVTPYVRAAHGSLEGRIGIYRNTVQQSLIDILATAFPVVQRIVGPQFFKALAREFVIHHPPDVPQLSKYGGALATFIEGHPRVEQIPYLADVARLEWARSESYFARDSAPFNPVELSTIPPDQLPNLRFQLHPATRLVLSNYPIHRIWMVNQANVLDVPEVDMSVCEHVIITRPHLEVTVRQLSAGDGAFMSAIAAGQSLGEAAAAALRTEPQFDLQTALQQHFLDGSFYSAA